MGLVGSTLQYAMSGGTPKATQREDGTWEVKDLKIFKAATFKDSRGRQKTWTPDELAAMATNFTKLRNDSLLVDVPVREDHTQSVAAVKGYFTGMHSDGTFLYGDIEFTEPDGAEKYNRGTYRSRSMEIASYETNGATPTTYWPVATGLAFVDIGAVEGLFSAHRDEGMNDVTVKFRIKGVETDNAADVQAHIDSLEKAEPAPAATFRVNGTDGADFAKAQAHIDSLEAFRAESIDAGRDTFVDSLVADRKLAAPQADDTKKFVKSLTPEQFESYKTQFEKAPAVFAKNAGDGNGKDQETDEMSEAEICAETVAMHRNGGMSEEKVRETDSFRRHMALTGKPA